MIKHEIEEIKSRFSIKSIEEIEKEKHFINVKSYQCELNDGRIVIRDKILKGDRDGSASIIVPITETGKVILVIQPRILTKNKISVEFPAGYIDEGENPKEAALRELREETGYIPNEMIELAEYYQDQGCSSAYNYCYLALGCKKVYEQSLDRDEYIEYVEAYLDEVLELLDEGTINDANSIIAIERARKVLNK